MRKILVAALPAVGMLTGCKKSEEPENTRFKLLEDSDVFDNFYVAYDTETGIEYAVSNGPYDSGTLTVLVDANGNPLIYEGWKNATD